MLLKKGRSKGYPKRILWVRPNDFIGLFSLLFPKGMFLLPEKHHPSWLPVGYNLVPGVFPLESGVGPLAFSKEGKGLGTRLRRMWRFFMLVCRYSCLLLKEEPKLVLICRRKGKFLAWGGILRRQLQADKTSYFGRRWKLDRNRKPRMKVSGCHGNWFFIHMQMKLAFTIKVFALGIVSKVKVLELENCLFASQ